jgi:hypothetical protein
MDLYDVPIDPTSLVVAPMLVSAWYSDEICLHPCPLDRKRVLTKTRVGLPRSIKAWPEPRKHASAPTATNPHHDGVSIPPSHPYLY